jgi:hypothetical protein
MRVVRRSSDGVFNDVKIGSNQHSIGFSG